MCVLAQQQNRIWQSFIILKAGRNICHGQVFDENFLMMIATFGAFAVGEYLEAVAVMLFYQTGELFQGYAVGKSRQSIADMMAREGVFFDFGDNERLPGKMQFHYRLAFDTDGIPMMYVFSTCRHFIRTVPNLIYDESNVEDINTKSEDHIYDCVRYVLMANPISPRRNFHPSALPAEDPLSLSGSKLDKYNFYTL